MGVLQGMMTTHVSSFDGELDKTWTAEEAAEQKPLYRRKFNEKSLKAASLPRPVWITPIALFFPIVRLMHIDRLYSWHSGERHYCS